MVQVLLQVGAYMHGKLNVKKSQDKENNMIVPFWSAQ